MPAESAPAQDCPQAFPIGNLKADQSVTGLTVSKGTSPDGFKGRVIGVLQDGIAPDLDMILVRLESTAINQVGGIWAGMSGSPVYASNGQLIGAVSYGLAGTSPVAGVTPAADMQKLLTTPAAAARVADQTDPVALPRSIQRELVASGAATEAEAGGGMTRLPLPLGISGMATAKRLRQVKKKLGLENVRYYRAGTATGATTAPDYPIVTGGNLAASLSYGDVSAVGVGTATAVCGNEVLAFGHPMMFTGPSSLTLHGADALYVQEDRAWVPFKVANPGAPQGSIAQDRLAAILALFGTPPAVAGITSYVKLVGGGARTGTTKVSVPDVVPDLAASHLLVDQDRVFDAIGKGSALVGWTVKGKRANGTTFWFRREDRFASTYDISFAPAGDLWEQLYRVQNNGSTEVTFTGVTTASKMNRAYQQYTIKGVQVRSGGSWRALPNRVLRLRAGTTQRFRVTLASAALGTARIRLDVPIPRRAVGRTGQLEFVGGNSFWGGDGFDGSSAPPLNEVLRQIRTAPRNDHVIANLSIYRGGGAPQRSVRVKARAVVDGYDYVEVYVR